jgi:hypothetical protein
LRSLRWIRSEGNEYGSDRRQQAYSGHEECQVGDCLRTIENSAPGLSDPEEIVLGCFIRGYIFYRDFFSESFNPPSELAREEPTHEFLIVIWQAIVYELPRTNVRMCASEDRYRPLSVHCLQHSPKVPITCFVFHLDIPQTYLFTLTEIMDIVLFNHSP